MAKTFRSLLSIFLAVLMVCTLITIPTSAASVSLSKTSITLTKGYQTTLKVSGTTKSVTWSTGDKSIATVSNGKVVGKAPGTTYIYAKVSNTTLKCKVKVVAAKITASSSNIIFDESGETKTITMTVKGSHSGLTVGSTNKKVATASWVKPVKWDGDKIKLKITAKGEGDAKIKVYLKNYSSTCYKYINVTVGDGDVFEDEETSGSMSIVPYTTSVNVGVNESYTLQVYCTKHDNLGYQFSDPSVATLSAKTASGLYRNFSIKGIKSGSTTLRLYNKKNTKNYTDVKITVGGAAYYAFGETRPATNTSTDKVLTVQVNSKNYYMLVPANYDPAYTNTLIANKFNKYSYYTIYDMLPSRLSGSDTYKEFANKNGVYVNPKYTLANGFLNNNIGTKRYILLPNNYDQVKLNTAVAQYNNVYEYWTVYNVSPTVSNTWMDYVETWTINDPSTGKTVTRYMLVPYSEWDQDRIDQIKQNDLNANSGYTYYQVYSKFPTVDAAKDIVVMFTKAGSYRYMVVPATGADIIKRNDSIKNDTGVYEPYIMYSTPPTANTAAGEYVLKSQYGSKYVYILCTYPQNSAEHALYWGTVSSAAPKGT